MKVVHVIERPKDWTDYNYKHHLEIEYDSPVSLDKACRDIGEGVYNSLDLSMTVVWRGGEPAAPVPTFSTTKEHPGIPYGKAHSEVRPRLFYQDGELGYIHVVTKKEIDTGWPNPVFVVQSLGNNQSRRFSVRRMKGAEVERPMDWDWTRWLPGLEEYPIPEKEM